MSSDPLPELSPDNGTAADAALLRLGAMLNQAGYAFVAISPASHRRVNSRPGNGTADDLRGIFGWNRGFRDDYPGAELLALMRQAGIVAVDGDINKSMLRAATLDGQLYFHSAYPTSDNDAVFFGPDTYRYVQLLHRALSDLPRGRPLRAVDIGCGAGPGALTLATLLPGAEVWATDINPRALRLAGVNLALAGARQVRVRHSDLLHDLDGGFDLIVSNPPFMMDQRQRLYCHGGGQFGEGLSLDIVRCALRRLNPGGRLVVYTCAAIIDGDDPFRNEAAAMAGGAGAAWRYHEIDPDVFGGELGDPLHYRTDRIAAVALQIDLPLA